MILQLLYEFTCNQRYILHFDFFQNNTSLPPSSTYQQIVYLTQNESKRKNYSKGNLYYSFQDVY